MASCAARALPRRLMVPMVLLAAVAGSVQSRSLPLIARLRGGADLDYPIPPNPFAPTGSKGEPKPPLPKAGSPQPGSDSLTLPGGEDFAFGGAGVELNQQEDRFQRGPDAPVAAEGSLVTTKRKRLRWQPLLCLGLIGVGCGLSRPEPTGLLLALEAHNERFGALIPSHLRQAEAIMHNGPLGSVAVHSEIVWLGVLGAWLPLVPASTMAARHWLPSLDAAQVIIYTTFVGYLLRRILPRSETFLASSLRNLLRGRIWTLLTASFSPAGIVHWLHTTTMLLVVMPSLEAQLGKWHAVGAFAAAGVCASLGASIAQMPFTKTAEGRASTSGAVMGLIALRASLLPDTTLRFGTVELAIGRMLLMHLLLDFLSNPTPRPRGAERLAGLLGGTALVAVRNPQLRRELLTAEGWKALFRSLVTHVQGFM